VPKLRADACTADQCFAVRAECQHSDRSADSWTGERVPDRLLSGDIPQLRYAVVAAGSERRTIWAKSHYPDRVSVSSESQRGADLLMVGDVNQIGSRPQPDLDMILTGTSGHPGI
jgi:hypothetical protein